MKLNFDWSIFSSNKIVFLAVRLVRLTSINWLKKEFSSVEVLLCSDQRSFPSIDWVSSRDNRSSSNSSSFSSKNFITWKSNVEFWDDEENLCLSVDNQCIGEIFQRLCPSVAGHLPTNTFFTDSRCTDTLNLFQSLMKRTMSSMKSDAQLRKQSKETNRSSSISSTSLTFHCSHCEQRRIFEESTSLRSTNVIHRQRTSRRWRATTSVHCFHEFSSRLESVLCDDDSTADREKIIDQPLKMKQFR